MRLGEAAFGVTALFDFKALAARGFENEMRRGNGHENAKIVSGRREAYTTK